MSKFLGWLKTRFATFDLVPDYFGALAQSWQDVLWGASMPAIAFGLYWAFYEPSAKVLTIFFVAVMFVAGYYIWRADHLRLMPKLTISKFILEETGLAGVPVRSIYIHILPVCLTDAPVSGCEGRLLRIHKWSTTSNAWELTPFNEPLELNWSWRGAVPITIQPGIDQRLNVCFITSTGQMVADVKDSIIPIRGQSVLNGTDRFRFDIKITANECPPVDAVVEVQGGVPWNKPTVVLTVAAMPL